MSGRGSTVTKAFLISASVTTAGMDGSFAPAGPRPALKLPDGHAQLFEGLDRGFELLVLDEEVVRRIGGQSENVDPGVGQGVGDRGEEPDQAERQDHVERD